jgi:hypothetical protein
MQRGDWNTVHFIGDNRVRMRRLANRKVTNKIRYFCKSLVGSVEGNVFRFRFDSRLLEYVCKPRSGPSSRSDCTFFPLDSCDRRIEESPAVSRTLERYR